MYNERVQYVALLYKHGYVVRPQAAEF